MRSIITQSLAYVLLLASCQSKSTPNPFEFENSSKETLADQLIVLKRTAIEEQTGSLEGTYIYIDDKKGVPMVIQFDDLNDDGKWDEAAFLYTFAPNEKVTFKPQKSLLPIMPDAMVRAHVRQMKKNADNTFGPEALDKDTMPVNALPTDFSKIALPPYLTEGPAWENDKVGFRLYFDVRNGKDIWGKTTARMVLDEVGTDTAKNYHHQADWGMDVLKVGASLGAGSLALQMSIANGKKDTLVRLGGKNIEQVTYEKVADGPVRAICRLKYANLKIAEGIEPVTVVEEIHIWGGQYFYESHVTVTGAPKDAQLVTGIVNLHSNAVHELSAGKFKGIYTYDVQSENKDKLGMAVVMPSAQVAGTATTPNANTDIQNTYIIKAKIKDKEPVIYRFYAGWEKSDKRFTSIEGFEQFLKKDL